MADMTMTEKDVAQQFWWVPLIRGIAALIIGIFFLTLPAQTAVIVVAFVGLYWFISGIFDLVMIFADRRMWGWKLFVGILGVAAGWIVMAAVTDAPLYTALGLGAIYIWVLGFFGILIGVAEIIRAFQGDGWAAGVLGGLSIVFGGYLLANAAAVAVFLPWVFGVFGIVFGIIGIIGAFQLRKA